MSLTFDYFRWGVFLIYVNMVFIAFIYGKRWIVRLAEGDNWFSHLKVMQKIKARPHKEKKTIDKILTTENLLIGLFIANLIFMMSLIPNIYITPKAAFEINEIKDRVGYESNGEIISVKDFSPISDTLAFSNFGTGANNTGVCLGVAEFEKQYFLKQIKNKVSGTYDISCINKHLGKYHLEDNTSILIFGKDINNGPQKLGLLKTANENNTPNCMPRTHG